MTAKIEQLSNKKDRSRATIAMMATLDTINGGARALSITNRMEQMGLPDASEYQDIVSNVYSASTGRLLDEYKPTECRECGQVHLGSEAAYRCCELGLDCF